MLLDLALQVTGDGEGAQKRVRIDVTGAANARSAKRIAMAVANSPLVKTAIAGEDANWGRIVMAVGKSGEPADRDKLSIGVGGVWMARDGAVIPGYDETPVVAHMKGQEVEIAIDIGLGQGQGDRLDLRSDARLHRHQRLIPKLISGIKAADGAFAGLRQGPTDRVFGGRTKPKGYGGAFIGPGSDIQLSATQRHTLHQPAHPSPANIDIGVRDIVGDGNRDGLTVFDRGEQDTTGGCCVDHGTEHFLQQVGQGCAAHAYADAEASGDLGLNEAGLHYRRKSFQSQTKCAGRIGTERRFKWICFKLVPQWVMRESVRGGGRSVGMGLLAAPARQEKNARCDQSRQKIRYPDRDHDV